MEYNRDQRNFENLDQKGKKKKEVVIREELQTSGIMKDSGAGWFYGHFYMW